MSCQRTHTRPEAPITASPSVVSSSSVCTKCGTAKKSGKRSCCARGGAWFENCGDAGNTKFDHTWAEGIRVCKDLATSASVKSSVQTIMLHHVGVIDHPLNTFRSQAATHRQTNISHPGSMPNAVNTDFRDRTGLTKLVVCILIFSIIFQHL